MNELERLARLVASGDRQAAQALLPLARRSAAWDEAMRAVVALGDLDTLCALLAEMHAAGASDALAAHGASLGVDLEPAVVRRIDALRQGANRGRASQGLSFARVMAVLLTARHSLDGWSLLDSAALGLHWPLVCLAVRDAQGDVTLGMHSMEAFEDAGWRVPDGLFALDPHEDGHWQPSAQERSWLEHWAGEPGGDFRTLVRARSAQHTIAVPERIAELVESLASTWPCSFRFDRVIDGLRKLWSHTPERAASLCCRAAGLLETWPDHIRSASLGDNECEALPPELRLLIRSVHLVANAAGPRRSLHSLTRWHDPQVRALRVSFLFEHTLETAFAHLIDAVSHLRPEVVNVSGGPPALATALLGVPRPATLRALAVTLLEPVHEAPMLDGLEQLELAGAPQAMRSALRSPCAATLRSLTLHCAAVREVLADVSLPALETLRCLPAERDESAEVEVDAVADAVAALRRSPLRHLSLDGPMSAEGLRTVLTGPLCGRLQRLSLSSESRLGTCGIGDRGCAILARHALPALERLALSGWRGEPITRYGVSALVAAPWMPQLRDLRLTHHGFGDAGVAVLCAGDRLVGLRGLDLSGNRIGPEGARRLAACAALAGLRWLRLDIDIGDEGLAALLASPHLRALETLFVPRRGTAALAAVPRERWPPTLRHLVRTRSLPPVFLPEWDGSAPFRE